MSKRILIVGQHFWPESFRVNDIADFLANEKGYRIDVLCGLPNYPTGKFPEGYGYFKNLHQTHNNISIHRALEIPRGNNSNFRIFLNYVSFPVMSLFLIPKLLTREYDKIFIYQLSPVMMSIAGIIIGKLTRTEIVMYVLDLWPENLYSVLNIRNRFLRKLASYVSHWHYRRADKLIALSESMKNQLNRIAPAKVIVVPQAAEKLYEQEIHDAHLEKRFKDTFNLVFAGNISPAQSFPTMIQAAKILKEKGLSNIRWIIIGDGMSKRQVERDVKKYNLDDIFVFEGQKPMNDIPKYTTIADGLVGCLSQSDLLEATIPAKVMSYIASAKPLILSMDGEVQELINTTIRGGFAGPTEDAETLANNIEKLYLLSPEDRKKIEKRLKSYHASHFERNLLLEKINTFIFS